MISAYEVSNETKKILDNALDEAISVEDANYLMNLKGSDVFALLKQQIT